MSDMMLLYTEELAEPVPTDVDVDVEEVSHTFMTRRRGFFYGKESKVDQKLCRVRYLCLFS